MIANLRLQQFRSYQDATFEFGEGVNIVVGPNGSGKTNLLEAILVVSRGNSYRVPDQELVRFDCDWLRLDVHEQAGTDKTLKIILEPKIQKSLTVNGKEYKRIPYTQTAPVVLFEPNQLQLLGGSPEGRRTYIDDILEQIKPGYAPLRRNYKRVLAQRNALLKRGGRITSQELFPWNLRLSELGAVVHRSRAELIAATQDPIGNLYTALSHSSVAVAVSYDGLFDTDTYETRMMQALEASLSKDIERGFTGVGPHREDMQVLFDGKPVSLVASRGEVRTATLALKILELETLEAATGKRPIMLLDDVFSELDGARRRALTTYLSQYQTFLTTTDADIVVKHFTSSTIIPITLG